MNTHKIWLAQLKDQYNTRMSQGKLTDDEIVKNRYKKSIHGAIQEVAEPVQLDEVFPAVITGAKMLGGMVGRGVAKRGIGKIVGRAAVSAVTPGQEEAAESIEQSEEDALLEEIAYAMIEVLEEQIGRKLSPEEIDEFVENNYETITEEAKNQVTAHAHEGDKNKGVGADAPEEPSSKPLPMGKVVKAKGTGPKRVGGDAY